MTPHKWKTWRWAQWLALMVTWRPSSCEGLPGPPRTYLLWEELFCIYCQVHFWPNAVFILPPLCILIDWLSLHLQSPACFRPVYCGKLASVFVIRCVCLSCMRTLVFQLLWYPCASIAFCACALCNKVTPAAGCIVYVVCRLYERVVHFAFSSARTHSHFNLDVRCVYNAKRSAGTT